MFLIFRIAWRYFFSRSSQTVVNRINSIALLVIIIASASLMIVLSAFSGLREFGLSFSSSFDPDYKILPLQGKTILVDSNTLKKLKGLSAIKNISPILEEKVFLSFNDKSQVAYLKGVSPDYLSVVRADSLVTVGEWLIPDTNCVVAGYGIGASMDLGVYDYNNFLEISFPQKSAQKNLRQNPFLTERAVTIGLYQISEDIDKKYVFSNISFARKLFQYPNEAYSAIEIQTKPNMSYKGLYDELERLIGNKFILKDRVALNSALYKMLNTENIAVYLIFTLVLVIAMFNVVGALIMMILDKRSEIKILDAMGATREKQRGIFFLLGVLISLIGGTIGIIVASIAVLVQQATPFLFVPGTSLPYPVKWEFENFILVILTLFTLGFFTSAWASREVKKLSMTKLDQ
tara:strand:+ start:638 stop:1849 length:1212 start_codon:yes stop_codon:yes gene_type:complete